MFSWDQLKKIGQSRLLSLTMIVPFLGYLILFNQVLNEWLINSYRFLSLDIIQLEVAGGRNKVIASQLYFIYYGLSLLGVASMFFYLFCPVSMKEYSSEYQFVHQELGIMTVFRAKKIIRMLRIRCKNDNAVMNQLNSINCQSLAEEKWLNKADSCLLLSVFWQQDSLHHGFIRWLVSILYLLGFFVLSIPSLKTFFYVGRSLVSN